MFWHYLEPFFPLQLLNSSFTGEEAVLWSLFVSVLGPSTGTHENCILAEN